MIASGTINLKQVPLGDRLTPRVSNVAAGDLKSQQLRLKLKLKLSSGSELIVETNPSAGIFQSDGRARMSGWAV